MEDFLKEKFNELEANFQDDWNVFEQKLERALFFKRMRIGAALAIFLIATSIGIFGTSSLIGFGAEDQAPFGFLTEEGYQSSGSHSQWKKETGPSDIQTQPGPDATAKSSGTVFKPPKGLEMGKPGNKNTSVATSSNTPLPASNKFQPANKAAVPSENQEKTLAGNTAAVVATAAKSAGATSQTTAPSPFSKSPSTGAQPKTVQEQLEEPSGATLASAQEPTASVKGEPTDNPDLMGADDKKIDLSHSKPLVLSMPSLSAIAGDDMLAAQHVRAPTQAIKVTNVDRGPYISPLQQKSVWEYSIKVYPNFTFRKFTVDEDKTNLIHRDFIDQVKVSETGGFSLNIGFEVSRKVGRATYINSGLEYISYKTEADFDFTNFRRANINEQTGTITSYSLMEESEQITFSDKNTYHYLNVPLSIAYKPWASDHVRLNMEVGVSYMYFVAARGKSMDYQTLEIIDLSDRDFRNHMGSMQLKVGATYYISPQFNLGFEPTFVYFTNTIYTEDYPFEVIPYSVGLNLKLQVKLN